MILFTIGCMGLGSTVSLIAISAAFAVVLASAYGLLFIVPVEVNEA